MELNGRKRNAQRLPVLNQNLVPFLKRTDSSKPNARDLRAARRQLADKGPTADDSTMVPLPSPQTECTRAITQHPHTISTTVPPKPIAQWPALQNLEDIPENMTRVPPEEIRKGLPQDLVVPETTKDGIASLYQHANAKPSQWLNTKP